MKDFVLKPVDQDEFHQTLTKTFTAIETDYKKQQLRARVKAVSIVKKLLLGENLHEGKHDCTHPFFDANAYTFIIVEINGLDVDYWNSFERLKRSLGELKGQHHYLAFEGRDNFLNIVINDIFLSDNKYTVKQFLLQWYHHIITNQLDLDIHLYCGETISAVDKLERSYKTAMQNIQYKYIFDERIITSEMTKSDPVYFIELEQHYYDTMMEFIEENKKVQIGKQLHEIMLACRNKHFAKDAFRTVVNRLTHEILTRINEADGDEKEISCLQEMLEWGQYALTLEQLENLWLHFLLESSEMITRLHQENAQGIIYQVKKYIHTHYDQNLTLKSIGSKFYMNPVYIGQLFKKTYGMYFKDYLLTVRIEAAKKLLRKTDSKVYEVAEKIGFNNSDYFVTQFEKIVGTTPSQYRKSLMNKIS